MRRELLESAAAVRAAAQGLRSVAGGQGGSEPLFGPALRAAFRRVKDEPVPAELTALARRLDEKGGK